MRRYARALVLSLLLLRLLVSPACAEGKCRALLVGCDHFVTQLDTYPSSRNNVSRLALALSEGSMDWAAITTRENVTDAFELSALIDQAFADADAGDVSYFYISTHGLWNAGLPAGDMRFVLSDGESEGNVTAYELRAFFDRVKGTKVLLLDACHSGSMIGKGAGQIMQNIFAAPEYKILCSSGGAEESWFWLGRAENAKAGAGYFSGALVNGLSAAGGYGADDNCDGAVTLTELKRYLLLNHGASTVQSYPEEDDFPIFTYDLDMARQRYRESAIDHVVFEDGALSPDDPTVYFSFTVQRDVRVAYQLVFQRNGRWDFDRAQLYWDNDERFGVHGDTPGYLSPGYKEREITFSPDGADSYGYVLFQMLTVSGAETTVVSSRVLCVPPENSALDLQIEADPVFVPSAGEELSIIVRHAYPCELTVTLETPDGDIVRRLAARAPTRPQQIDPTGTSFIWSGLDAEGVPANPGEYVIHIKAYTAAGTQELYSSPVTLR